MKKVTSLLFALFSLSLITKAQTDSTGKLTCEQDCYNKYVQCVINTCCPYGGCSHCVEICEAKYWPCMAMCSLPGTLVKFNPDSIPNNKWGSYTYSMIMTTFGRMEYKISDSSLTIAGDTIRLIKFLFQYIDKQNKYNDSINHSTELLIKNVHALPRPLPGTLAKARVLRVRDVMAYVKIGHNYGWIVGEGLKRGQRIMVAVTNIIK